MSRTVSIKVATLNNRGNICKSSKASFLYDFIKNYKIDIICLQETHLNDIEIAKNIENKYIDYNFKYVKTNKKSKGVAILIKKKIRYAIIYHNLKIFIKMKI